MPKPQHDNVIDLKPSASIVYVDPTIAARWLERNHVNRNIRAAKVATYARDMAAGNWHNTGEPIKFAADGRLLDGQHRLTAILSAGVTVPMFVVRGLVPDAQAFMDTGASRTSSDALAMRGYKNSVALGAITRAVLLHETGTEPSRGEILEWVELYPDLQIAAQIAVAHARGCDLPPSIVGLSSWVIGRVNGWDEASTFWSTADSLVGLSPGDPILAMLKCFAEYRRAGKKLSSEAYLSAIIRAYNHRRKGNQLKLLKVNSPNGGVIPVPEVAS